MPISLRIKLDCVWKSFWNYNNYIYKFIKVKATSTNLYSIERNRELIFIESLLELQNRKNIISPYNLIRQSAILRFLLIDGDAFYTVINKKYKLKIATTINNDLLSTTSISSVDNDNRSFIISKYKYDSQGKLMTIKQFLDLPIIKINNLELRKYADNKHIKIEYNINSLIKLVANAHGGVHIEKWTNIPVDLMTDNSSPFNINNNSKLHLILNNIADITILLLKPLFDQVKLNLMNTKSIGAEGSQVFYLK